MKSESDKELIALYTDCVNCSNNENDCPSIWKDFSTGVIPRGFYFESSNIQILVIAKNPGHPLEREQKLLVNKSGKELLNSYFSFHRSLYKKFKFSSERSTTFHKNLFNRYLPYFLDIPAEKIYSKIAHTNLVKCSTRNEQERLNKRVMLTCFNKYLLNEIRIYQPKVILALGNEVYQFLKKHQDKFNVPIIKIKHPSYFYRKEEEKEILKSIKEEIHTYLT